VERCGFAAPPSPAGWVVPAKILGFYCAMRYVASQRPAYSLHFGIFLFISDGNDLERPGFLYHLERVFTAEMRSAEEFEYGRAMRSDLV
jgi:hypothetical protein